MAQEKEKRKFGRPKGTPKTGGRKKGTPNKNNRRIREIFVEYGFDFPRETINAFEDLRQGSQSAQIRLELLIKLAPFFMQRLRQEEESLFESRTTEAEDDKAISTEDLLKLLKK